jgi:hypothetical protein
MAVREGMMISRGERCLMMDADGATRVSDLEVLEKALSEKQTQSEWGGRASAGALRRASPPIYRPRRRLQASAGVTSTRQ